MSHSAARHDQHANPGDEDVPVPQARQPEPRKGVRPGRPADDGVSPPEPDAEGLELTGDDDLAPADLGPADPHATNPDSGSDWLRKIARARRSSGQ
jgi:hypothetical protein